MDQIKKMEFLLFPCPLSLSGPFLVPAMLACPLFAPARRPRSSPRFHSSAAKKPAQPVVGQQPQPPRFPFPLAASLGPHVSQVGRLLRARVELELDAPSATRRGNPGKPGLLSKIALSSRPFPWRAQQETSGSRAYLRRGRASACPSCHLPLAPSSAAPCPCSSPSRAARPSRSRRAFPVTGGPTNRHLSKP
jgi:hypothetical protein